MAQTKITRTTTGGIKTVLALSKIDALLSLDPYWASFENIAARVRQLNEDDRGRLLLLCEDTLNKENLRRDDHARISTVKVVVALVPDSVSIIRKWLARNSGAYVYEVHFTLFCFLDNVPTMPNTREFTAEIPILLEEYLRQIMSESAQAAWMAGDLLGDHWRIAEALPILIRVAKEARFAVGRNAAIHGLAHILTRLKKADKRPIITLLNEIVNHDASHKVRGQAKMVLDGIAL